MATLITADTISGRLVCNARCYNATRPDCDCICGGRNHGVGYAQAVMLTRRHTEEIRREEPGLKRITFNAEQEPLFPIS